MMPAVKRHLSEFAAWFAGLAILTSSLPAIIPAQATLRPGASLQILNTPYIDMVYGTTVDELVTAALQNNAEVVAMRKESAAGIALVKQAGLRANPMVEVSGARQIGGTDNNIMVQGAQSLELGGRRPARIRVAAQELEVRKQAAAEKERQVAADVRIKFGDALAAATKLKVTEDIIDMEKIMFELVAARVTEGRSPPLEQNMVSVELNRMRAERETAEGTAEMRMLELRNLAGIDPDEPLRLKGDFSALLGAIPPQEIATARAFQTRPDLAGARAVEQLQLARIEQARAEGKIDADVMLGYQRMNTGFPLLGVQDSTGALLPIEDKMHFFTFGVRLNLPVLNSNQGTIEAARLEADAARSRREFGELTVRREIASAYARYNRAIRAVEIYRVGVRDQSAANLDVVRQTYELGSKSLLDYIGEHHRFMETESGFIGAQLEAYIARIEILRATFEPTLLNK